MENVWMVAIYVVPLGLMWCVYALLRGRRNKRAHAVQRESQEAGLIEPASLHPDIDPTLCLGCGACVKACPEQTVLGILNGKAVLVEPASCIGHGACRVACPFDAITLVFGTATRGVDIPFLNEDFQTNVPGVFIAGELGGMGLIRNAIEQGRQALDSVAGLDGLGAPGQYDVVIVGAGPAGFSASLAAMEKGLSYLTLEQETLGGAVAHYPRGKLVMTSPATLPIVGKVRFTRTTKEELLEFWQGVERSTGVKISYKERVVAITKMGPAQFEVRTESATYAARAVILTIGRRGTPRKLGVPEIGRAHV